MDTIEVKVIVRNDIIMEEMDLLKENIAWLISRHRHNYCTILEESRNKERGLIIKISYPRYFKGNNSFLITRKSECLEVQKDFVNSIKENVDINDIVIGIQLTRVDIPFTYLIADGTDFNSYANIYRIFAFIYNCKKKEARAKGYIDLLDNKFETVVYSDNGKTDKSSNNRLMIYNQYQNLKSKLSEEDIEELLICFPNLKNRMRLEVSKRIRRQPFNLDEFASFDIFGTYFEEYKKYIFENVLDHNLMNAFYNQRAKELANKLEICRKETNFNYELFIWQNYREIYDYKILRQALKMQIDNPNTLENAITKVRKIIKSYEKRESIIIMDTSKIITELARYLYKLKIKD